MKHSSARTVPLLAALAVAACQGKPKATAMADSAAAAGAPAPAPAPAASQTPLENLASTAPRAVVDAATIMNPPKTEGGQPTQVRAGTNGWTCVAASPTFDAMCADRNFTSLLTALMAKKDPQVKDVGFAYMLHGDSIGGSNTDPFATGPTADNHWTKAPPHVMVVFPSSKALDAFPTDPANGGPWVMWKGTKYAHLMVPVR